MRPLRAAALTGLLLAASLGNGIAHAREAQAALVPERVVLLMRHGVRPPTKFPAMPEGTARDAWPAWSVPPGWLTPHGRAAIAQLARWDAQWLTRAHLLPARGCPPAGAVQVIADSDQRTIATGEAWAQALAPHCAIAVVHQPQDTPDPLFAGVGNAENALDVAQADAQVQAAIGPAGLAALDAREAALLTRLDAILCGDATASDTTPCGVRDKPTTVSNAELHRRPKLSGQLDRASTAAQILLLEYADGKPLHEVGWGRATPADIARLAQFHALEFAILARPRAIAAPHFARLAQEVKSGLRGDRRITALIGHDTNIANLAGLLDAHWQIAGTAADDPLPGGAIVLQQLRGASGKPYVRSWYRAQTLAQLRNPRAGDVPVMERLFPSGCNALGERGLCTLAGFEGLLGHMQSPVDPKR